MAERYPPGLEILAGPCPFRLACPPVVNLFTNGSTTTTAGADQAAASRTTSWRASASGRLLAAVVAVVLATGWLDSPVAADSVGSLRAEAQAVATRLNSLDAQMARLDESLDEAQNRVARVHSQLAAARRAFATAQARVGSKRSALRREAIAAYVSGGNTPGLVQLIQSSESEAAVRQSYLGSVADSQQGAIDALQGALVNLRARSNRLAVEQTSARTALGSVESARAASAQAASAEQSQLALVNGRLGTLVDQIEAQQAAAASARLQVQYLGHDTQAEGARDQVAVGPLPTPPSVDGGAGTAVQWAEQELGKPYEYGAAGPDAFDCSGLTMFVWGQAGVGLPHSAAAQWDDTTRIPVSELQPGDLVFYYQPIDHVGIYVGGGQMIVADHTGTNVRYASIYRDGLDGGGRVG